MYAYIQACSDASRAVVVGQVNSVHDSSALPDSPT